MEEVNRAFIQKLAWFNLSKPQMLLVNLCWQGIFKALALRDNICFLPSNGSTLHIRVDPWIPHLQGHYPVWLDSTPSADNLQFVSDLVDRDSRNWNFPLMSLLFSQESISFISKCLLQINNFKR